MVDAVGNFGVSDHGCPLVSFEFAVEEVVGVGCKARSSVGPLGCIFGEGEAVAPPGCSGFSLSSKWDGFVDGLVDKLGGVRDRTEYIFWPL